MRHFTLTLAGLLSAALFMSCGKKTPDEPAVYLITSATGKSHMIRDAKKEPAKAGVVLRAGDQITTEDGTVDLQSQSGSVVRIKAFSTVGMAKLTQKDTKISIENGSMIAKVKKTSPSENFSVISPTAIAGVRGTTFSVEVADGTAPKVRVLEGSVAMSPRLPALDKLTEEQIENHPELQKIVETIEKNEVILTEKTEGALDPTAEKQLQALNAKIEKGGPQALKASDTAAAKTAAEKPAAAQKTEISPQENAESETLVSVDTKLIETAAKGAKDQADKASKEIAAQHEERLDKAFDKIQAKTAEKKLASVNEIRDYYHVLEVVTMRDGKQLSGAVVAQAGNILLLHSVDGVYRLNKPEINFVDFYNVKTQR